MRWRGVLAVEGELTSDGRLIEPTAIQWGDDPIPLMRSVQADSRMSGIADWSQPLLGYVDSIERIERDGKVLILGEGPLLGDQPLPDSLDLSAVVTSGEYDVAGPGVDHPYALTKCRLRQVVVGAEKVWDECVLEVIEDAEV